jgi:hypothetical protein
MPQIISKLNLIVVISLLAGSSFAQDYFVLLRSEDRQPFYVRIGTASYNSTPEGHLILSRLKDSTYTIEIGFPSRPGSGQTYSFVLSGKDQELQIRERDGAGWGLYDPQRKEWFTALPPTGAREEVRALGVRRDDAFSRMMAGIVQDTAVLYNNYANPALATADSAPATLSAAIRSDTGSFTAVTPAKSLGEADTTAAATPTTTHRETDSDAATAVTANPAGRTRGTPAIATAGLRTDTLARTALLRNPNASPGATPAAAFTGGADSPIAEIHPDSLTTPKTYRDTATAEPLYRPIAGSPGHKSAPVLDSTGRQSGNAPIPNVVKLSEKQGARTRRLVYADKSNSPKADTVVVIIPLDSPRTVAVHDSPRAASVTRKGVSPDSSRPSVTGSPRTGSDSSRSAAAPGRNPNGDTSRLSAIRGASKGHVPNADTNRSLAVKGADSPALRQSSTAVHLIVPTPVNPPADKTRSGDTGQKRGKASIPYINSDCHSFATDYDVDKLRVKMLEAARDEDRIAAALKIFRTKCFYTRQIRALSEVFTTDAARYRFFETAYPFAADEHFHELGALFTDPVYANKFKTLMGGH